MGDWGGSLSVGAFIMTQLEWRNIKNDVADDQ